MLNDTELEALWDQYKLACPAVEPTANFMPALWQRIDSRNTPLFFFGRLARVGMAVSVALCLFLALLNVAPHGHPQAFEPTYADALAADQTAEKTDYTEAIQNIPADDRIYQEYR